MTPTDSAHPPKVRLNDRIACELSARGRIHKGLATDLTPSGLFVELPDSSQLEPGCEVQVHLRSDGDGPGIQLGGVVVHDQLGDPEDRCDEQGIGLRIIDAPPSYHRLFLAPGSEADGGAKPHTVDLMIEIDVPDDALPALKSPLRGPSKIVRPSEPGSDESLPAWRPAIEVLNETAAELDPDGDLPSRRERNDLPVRRPAVAQPQPARADAAPGDASAHAAAAVHEVTPPLAKAPEVAKPKASAPTPAVGPRQAIETKAEDTTARDASAAPAAPRPSGTPVSSRTPSAIVIYDGDALQDVYDLLEKIGVKPLRARLSGPTRFNGWQHPPRLVVLDAQDAIDIELPPQIEGEDVVRIAITSSRSSMLSGMLKNLGYSYLVRRPVHPEALEILLRHALNVEPSERRTHARAPFGVDARLQAGSWRWPHRCALLDLSASGCRVVTRQDLPSLSIVKLWLSPAVAGRRLVSLSGRIIRRRRDEATGEWSLAIRFVDVTAVQRGRLDSLLERTTIGPTSPLRDWSSWGPGAEAAASDSHSGEVSMEPEDPTERRFLPRADYRREVVTLDDSHEHVQAILTGVDLSTLGLRVEPHPALELGGRVVVAIHDVVGRGSIEIEAEVIRDDGERGVAMKFSSMSADCAARLEQLVEALPSLESQQFDGRSVMVGRIRTEQRSIPTADRSPEAETGSGTVDGPTPSATGLVRSLRRWRRARRQGRR